MGLSNIILNLTPITKVYFEYDIKTYYQEVTIMALEIITTGGGNATADSIVIPQTDLAAFGVTAPEMTADDTGLARAVWGFLKAVQAEDLSAALGFTKPASPTVTKIEGQFDNRSYSVTIQKYVDYQDGANGVVPLPTSGANSGLGGFALTDIFPNAVKVAAAGAVAAESLLIASADLTAIISSINHAGIDITAGQDNRELLGAIYEMFAEQLSLRDASTASAFIGLARGNLGQVAVIPAAYIAPSDPTSDLDATNASDGQVAVLSKTHTVTIQTEDDLSNDTIDVRVVTS